MTDLSVATPVHMPSASREQQCSVEGGTASPKPTINENVTTQKSSHKSYFESNCLYTKKAETNKSSALCDTYKQIGLNAQIAAKEITRNRSVKASSFKSTPLFAAAPSLMNEAV